MMSKTLQLDRSSPRADHRLAWGLVFVALLLPLSVSAATMKVQSAMMVSLTITPPICTVQSGIPAQRSIPPLVSCPVESPYRIDTSIIATSSNLAAPQRRTSEPTLVTITW